MQRWADKGRENMQTRWELFPDRLSLRIIISWFMFHCWYTFSTRYRVFGYDHKPPFLLSVSFGTKRKKEKNNNNNIWSQFTRLLYSWRECSLRASWGYRVIARSHVLARLARCAHIIIRNGELVCRLTWIMLDTYGVVCLKLVEHFYICFIAMHKSE